MKEKWRTVPFFLEQVEGKSLSSTLTEGLLDFILQKNDRLAPEQSLEGPGVMSVFTGRPAASAQTHTNTSFFSGFLCCHATTKKLIVIKLNLAIKNNFIRPTIHTTPVTTGSVYCNTAGAFINLCICRYL